MHFKVFKLNYKIIFLFLFIFFLISTICIYTYVLATATTQGIKVPIIMYHSVLKSRSNTYIVNPSVIENDFKYIKENGYTTITITDLINYVYNDSPLPEKPIIITFDDGHYNNLGYVLPLLEKYDMVAIISIVGKYTDTFSETDEANLNYSYLRWKDINELINTNRIEFQNHTYNLHSNNGKRHGCSKLKWESTEAYRKVLSDDILKLQEEFKNNANGYVPNCFTYPYGIISKDSINIIKDLGFKASLSCTEGVNTISKNPDCLYNLKRFNRTSSISTSQFFKKVFK